MANKNSFIHSFIDIARYNVIVSSCKNLPLLFRGAFAPSFIWCRRPCLDV